MKKTFFLLILAAFASPLCAQSLKPTDLLALLQGTVTNFKGKALGNETILFSDDKTQAIVKVNTDAKGRFEVLVPVGATYSLKYKTFTTDQEYTKMTVPADKEATYDVEIKIDPPKSIVLDNVYFDTGKSTLKPSSNKALNDLVEVLKLKSSMVIEIQGHTDNVGNSDENLKLSQARADEVKKYLVGKGIDGSRVTTKGYGQEVPIADNATDAGRSKNRRTSLKVVKE